MKVVIVSSKSARHIRRIVLRHGFKIVNKDLDFVLCHGGDGTVLYAERVYPGIPKLIIKSSRVHRKFDYTFYKLYEILSKIKSGRYRIKEEPKLVARFKNKKLVALNEIQIHTKLPIHALRFSLMTKKKEFKYLIGDGVVVATPFGSTAYYMSTGGKPFKKGIGISFNNLYPAPKRPVVLPSDSIVKIKIERGEAWLVSDNYEKIMSLKKEDTVTIKKSNETAKFIQVK